MEKWGEGGGGRGGGGGGGKVGKKKCVDGRELVVGGAEGKLGGVWWLGGREKRVRWWGRQGVVGVGSVGGRGGWRDGGVGTERGGGAVVQGWGGGRAGN